MDITKKIKATLAYADMSQRELADVLGTSNQNISQRINRGTLNANDLERIAEACRAELELRFVFPDGMKI